MPYEYHIRVELLHLLLCVAGAGEFLFDGEVDCRIAFGRAKRRVPTGCNAKERHRLHVCAAFAERFEPCFGELLGEKLDRQFLAACSWSTTFEPVAGEKHDVGLDAIGGNGDGLGRVRPDGATPNKHNNRGNASELHQGILNHV